MKRRNIMQKTALLSLRVQWFKLKAKEFIERYSAGLMVIALFLPGVAIGENLNLIFLAAIHPFIYIIDTESSFFKQLSWLCLLMGIFVVWARAQKIAINGGEFANQMKSLPLKKQKTEVINMIMVLISNHFLWFFMLYGVYHLTLTTDSSTVEKIRYLFLLVLLFTSQYIAVFYSKKPLLQALFVMGLIAVLLILPVAHGFEWIRMIGLILTLSWYTMILTTKPASLKRLSIEPKQIANKPIYRNLHFQIMVKSAPSSVFFRLLFLAGLLSGFILTAEHFSSLNDGDLTPFFFIIESILVYFLSGFYPLFQDQRKSMRQLLDSLPIKPLYWVKRDVLAVTVLSALIHTPYAFWQLNHFEVSTVLGTWAFHLILLLLSYPLRVLSKSNQTFITFVVILIITIITVYHLS